MGAYDVVEWRASWSRSSLLVFAGLFLFCFSLPFLARAYRGYYFWAEIVIVVLPVLSFLGTVLGVIARSRPGQRRGAFYGTVLNGAVLFSCVVAFVWTIAV